MISTILIPTDFSEVAGNALTFAIDLAKKTGAQLHVLHVKQVPVLDTSFPTDTYQLYINEIEKAAQEGIQKLETDTLKPSGIKYAVHSVIGFVNDEILHFVKTNPVDMILMGTTGASGIQELLIGSNAASVIARSEVPVLVIPPSAKHSEFKHILYASDYSEPEFPAFSRLVYMAELFHARISVLHVKSDADRYFSAANNFFARNKQHISVDDITIVNTEGKEIADAINSFIDEKNVDMLVLAKHNRSYFDRLFHRSLSKRMAYHTKVPLLVLHK